MRRPEWRPHRAAKELERKHQTEAWRPEQGLTYSMLKDKKDEILWLLPIV